MHLRTVLSFLLALFATTSASQATVIYSFSNVTMTNGVLGDPTMYLSGSFAIPGHSYAPLSNLTTAWHTPLAAVDLTVTDGAAFSRSFSDPNYFMYQDGLAVNGHYLVNLGPNAFMPKLDEFWDQIWITIDSNTLLTDGEFSTTTFARGFSTYSFVNGVDLDNTAPVSVVETVSEPPTILLLLSAGFAFLFASLAAARRQESNARATD